MKLPHVMPHTKAAWARRHPKDRIYVGRSVALSVAIHLSFAAMVGLLAIWLDRVTFSQSTSRAQTGPAPEQATLVNLVMTEVHPPPPTPPAPKPAPQLGLPVLPPVQAVPKPPIITIVPPPPQSVPLPIPKPVEPVIAETKPPAPAPSPTKIAAKPSNKLHPKFTTAHATGQGKAPDATSEQLATLGYPAPNYPPQAQAMHQSGTVLMEVAFGPDGKVAAAEIQKSSGSSILDMSTRSFIRIHWKDMGRANTIIHVPIIYVMGTAAAGISP